MLDQKSEMNERNILEKLKLDVKLSKEQKLRPPFLRNIIEMPSPKTHVLLKLNFKNAFNSLNRETMLKYVLAIRPSVHPLAFSACS